MTVASRLHSYIIALAACLIISSTGGAGEPQLHSGEYILEGGNGRLSLQKTEGKRFAFSILAVGANGHSCSLDGEVEKTQAHVPAIVEDRPCVVGFHATAKGVEVRAESDGCRDYCGVRAAFSGLYLLPAKGCAPAEVDSTRRQFKQLYNKKAFLQAKRTLEPILSRCAATLNYLDTAWVRNDLAITHYRLKEFTACMTVLQPLVEAASTYEGADVENVLPELQELVPVMKATLVNLKLCGPQAHQ